MTVAATVTFHRPASGWRDMLRPYKLLIDGQVKGTIRRDQARSFVVAPGRHVAQARIDWTGSRPVEFEVGPGGTVELVVTPNGELVNQFWQIFTRDRWLSLTQMR
ncbi:hypothetical protein [Plantactinospora sp. GCM10030261]|uniref:hypothetical protein n=1 Tax=Plantactinospora sp. GCM10030261 TaxID=3273420 RepID=UPI0036123809